MSAEAQRRPEGRDRGRGSGPGGGEPSEEELRAAYEAELSRITSDRHDRPGGGLAAEHRRAPAGARRARTPARRRQQRDLEQVRDAIDAVRALLEILERTDPAGAAPLRDALSRLQMAYAREAQRRAAATQRAGARAPTGAGPSGEPGAGGARAPAASHAGGRRAPPGPGPAESSGRLWVPGR